MIETKLLCISLSNLADMLTMVNPIDLEVTVQRLRSPWVSLTNVGCAGMLRFALLYFEWGAVLEGSDRLVSKKLREIRKPQSMYNLLKTLFTVWSNPNIYTGVPYFRGT